MIEIRQSFSSQTLTKLGQGAFSCSRGRSVDQEIVTLLVAGPELTEKLRKIKGRLGEYPHPGLKPALLQRKKQTTRLIKLSCPHCSYVVRTTRKWIEEGIPLCPAGNEMEVQAS